MECFICTGPAVIKDWDQNEKLVECDYCGDYRISGVARDVLANARVDLNKGSMLVVLARKRNGTGNIPLVQEIDLVYDSDQLARLNNPSYSVWRKFLSIPG